MFDITQDISNSLQQGRYRVRSGQDLGKKEVQYVASRTTIVFQSLCFVSAHIVVMEKDKATTDDMSHLFETGYQLGKKINRIPLIRGMQFVYWILPVIIGRDPDPNLLLSVSTEPIMKFALMGLPVVIDITERDMGFFQGNRKIGGLFWPMIQDIVLEYVKPLVYKMSINNKQGAT